jgi:hypothetical protein
MMKNPGSDAKRQLLPPPPGRGPVPKSQGLSTFLKLTDKTGLTSTAKNGNVTIPSDRSPVPGIARIFNAIPGVERSDFAPQYRQMLVRK